MRSSGRAKLKRVMLGGSGLVVAAGLVAGAGAPRVRVWAAEAGITGSGANADAGSARELVQRMIAKEDYEAQHRGRYVYLSQERSERTGGHLWTERVAETSAGRLRRLVAEDGQLLTGERAAAENARLSGIAANPEEFRRKSEALKNDEQHAKNMLAILPRAFLFEGMKQEGAFVRIDFKPNPDYTPQTMEERILHGMVGTMLVDPRASRLHRLDGRLPEDVSIGYGLIATVKAGSNFSTTREPVPGNEWKTAMMDTDINGRAIFFKAIGKKQHSEHSEFVPVAQDITVVQAVTMLGQVQDAKN